MKARQNAPVMNVTSGASFEAILSERRQKTAIGLSEWLLNAANEAAKAPKALPLARQVRDASAVHSVVYPSDHPTSVLNVNILNGIKLG